MKILSFFVTLILAGFVAQLVTGEVRDEKSVRLLKVHFASNQVDVEWVIPMRDLAALPMWEPVDGEPPLGVAKAAAVAREVLEREFPREALIIADIMLKNVRFLSEVRGSKIASENRWFYVVEAKPQTYMGEKIERRHLMTIVILMDGRVLSPSVSIRVDPNIVLPN